jgi:predicted signal transduction protein with EAL and GGDEF domain
MPFFVIALIIVASIFSLMYMREAWIGYVACELAISVLAFLSVQYALGRAAVLLGSSWVYFGVFTILLIPIAQLIAWLTLVDKRSKLKRSLASRGAQRSRAAGPTA